MITYKRKPGHSNNVPGIPQHIEQAAKDIADVINNTQLAEGSRLASLHYVENVGDTGGNTLICGYMSEAGLGRLITQLLEKNPVLMSIVIERLMNSQRDDGDDMGAHQGNA